MTFPGSLSFQPGHLLSPLARIVVCHSALPPLLSGRHRSVLAAEHRAVHVLIYSAEQLTAVETE